MMRSRKISEKSGIRLLPVAILLTLSLLLGVNCGGKPNPPAAFSMNDIMLGPGDVLNIQFSYTPELNTTQTIRPDGKISMQLIGETEAAGKTPAELHEELMVAYGSELRNQRITIVVESLYSQRVYVSGQITTPGVILFPGRLTAIEAIMEAGGFLAESANVSHVLVSRFENGVRKGYVVDMEPTLHGEEYQPFFLEPFDIVHVPEKKISVANRFINQYINNMIPAVVGTGLVYLIIQQ